MKVLTVVGARPQFIKAAPVSRAFGQLNIRELLVHTGQHYDPSMSKVFFDELGLPVPDVNLGVGSGSHAEQTAAMLRGLEAVILEHNPDWVLVYGDTNSTLAGALAAAKVHVPVAHVEAGLRSFNRRMPEEVNRIVADALSDILFAPTPVACENLRNEGVAERKIRLCGDVMYDATLMFGARANAQSKTLERLGLRSKAYVLATIHRAENTDNDQVMRRIVEGLVRTAQQVEVVWPMHPRSRKLLGQKLNDIPTPSSLHLIEPVGYLDMMMLERNASVIVTDSGGVQKEAFFSGVPCVTVREETEWTELVDTGWNRLCPPVSAEAIADAVFAAVGSTGRQCFPYGDGHAAQRIAKSLLNPDVGG